MRLLVESSDPHGFPENTTCDMAGAVVVSALDQPLLSVSGVGSAGVNRVYVLTECDEKGAGVRMRQLHSDGRVTGCRGRANHAVRVGVLW
jgi:hypothetical protein